MTGYLGFLIRALSEAEVNMVSVERIREYTKVNTEAKWEIEEQKPNDTWPDKGQLVMDNYATKYRAGLDLVLKGINCNIGSGEKVNIISTSHCCFR